MRIAVAGGTGVAGRQVVRALEDRGHTPVVLARSRGVDLVTGQGVARALHDADAVIDVSNITTTRRSAAIRYFEAASRNLLGEAARAGVRHHVVLSIVGADRVDFGYYAGKIRQEEIALNGPVPATVVRATQFHEFAEQILTRIPGPVAFVPRQRIRPVAAQEVGAELVAIAAGEPQGVGPELAGPCEHDLVDLARRVTKARGRPRAVLGVRLPGKAGRQMADGALLPRGQYREGAETFQQWLDRTIVESPWRRT